MEKGERLLKHLYKADLSVCDESNSFLQSGFWGTFKSRFGWEAHAFQAEWQSGEAPCEAKPLLVLFRALSRAGSLAYVPWGPELPLSCSCPDNAILELAETLKTILPKNTVFIRFDPPWHSETALSLPPPFIHSAADIQPPDTVILDLSQSMESLIEQMKPKWRYNAKLAIKKGVKVYQAGAERMKCFYELLRQTARRDGIAIHSFEYYQTLFESSWYKGKAPDIRLYLAEYEGELLAGIVTLFRGGAAVYLYGASSDKKRNLMAPYALQLKAFQDARISGCLNYDLFGIPPDDNPSHPMAGLYKFKTGFGGKIIHRSGSWDFPCRPLIYCIFRCAESARKTIQTRKKRKFKNK